MNRISRVVVVGCVLPGLILAGSVAAARRVPARSGAGDPAAADCQPFGGRPCLIWDSGPGRVQEPPAGDVPPTAGAANIDPHQAPRQTPAAQQQISDFLEPNGAVVDVCGGAPCHTSEFTP